MGHIDIERQDAVAVVTMNNPSKRNALDLDLRRALLAAFRELADDEAIRSVVLTGAEGAFCAGADVDKMGARDLAGSRQGMQTLHGLIRTLHGMDKPTIAAVRGPAVGIGFSLAMACDQVLASPSADFSQVFSRVGLAPDGGAIWFLARQLGQARAKELVFSARKLRAEEALTLGLVARVLPEDEVLPVAVLQAQTYAQGPGLALAMAKQLFAASVSPTLEQYLQAELLVGPQLLQTADHKEGRTAFQEKRKPRFTGH